MERGQGGRVPGRTGAGRRKKKMRKAGVLRGREFLSFIKLSNAFENKNSKYYLTFSVSFKTSGLKIK